MLYDTPTSSSPRRSFLQRLAGLSALVAAGGAPSIAQAQGGGATDPWLAKVTGKHKQLFDAPDVNSGFATIFASTYLRTMTDTYKLKPGDASVVIVYRHFAMPMLLNDAMWAKYKVGSLINVTDPVTKAPSLRNIFYKSKAGDIMLPDASIEKMLAQPVTFLACGVALEVLSGKAAGAVGIDPATAKKDWAAGLIPGVHVVPSGVLAVARAQEIGCHYCFAG
jgi:intracellular sulfur oxidation DsrE/DsrF family protein